MLSKLPHLSLKRAAGEHPHEDHGTGAVGLPFLLGPISPSKITSPWLFAHLEGIWKAFSVFYAHVHIVCVGGGERESVRQGK